MATLAENLHSIAQSARINKDERILNPVTDQVAADTDRIYADLFGQCSVRASRGFNGMVFDLANPGLYSFRLAQSFFLGHRVNNELLEDFARILVRRFSEDGFTVEIIKPEYGWFLGVSWQPAKTV